MAGFPRLPLVNGDMDDDLSLHLHTQIGPSNPLPSKKTSREEEMLRLLNEEDNSRGNNDFNKYFKMFQRTGKVSLLDGNESEEDEQEEDNENNENNEDNDDNEPETEDEEDNKYMGFISSPEDKNNDTELNPDNTDLNKPNSPLFNEFKKVMVNQKPVEKRGMILFSSIAFLIAFGFTLLMLNLTPPPGVSLIDDTNRSLGKRIKSLEDDLTKISANQDLMKSQYESLASASNSKFDSISNELKAMNPNLLGSEEFRALNNEFETIKQKFEKIEITSDTEAKLIKINEKLKKLQEINDNIDQVKDEIVNQFISSLPNHIPIYLKNKTMRILPEFHQYLYKFIEGYNKNITYNWDTFIKENESKLKDFLNNNNQKSFPDVKYLNKEGLEEIINKKLNANNKIFEKQFNNLVDNLNLVQSNISTELKLEGVKSFYLDNLLEIFAKGSIKVNYADYNLGSRILGFLTNTGNVDNKPFIRKLFLGWFDFFNANGISSTKNWKFNANNVLLDNSDNWECGSKFCSIGVRLFSPVILTDIIVKKPIQDYERPIHMALYIRPKSFDQVKDLIRYYNGLKFDSDSKTDSKYLKNFIKIKEIPLSSEINHVKMPISLVNLRIPVKDIYVEIRSSEEVIRLNNLQVYGIKEFDSYIYEEKFKLLLDKIYQNEDTPDSEDNQDTFENVVYDEIYVDNQNVLGADQPY